MNSRSWSQLAAGSKLQTIRCSSLFHSMNVLIFCVMYERARLNISGRDWFDESHKKRNVSCRTLPQCVRRHYDFWSTPQSKIPQKSASILNRKF